jgi:hypothetical protein
VIRARVLGAPGAGSATAGAGVSYSVDSEIAVGWADGRFTSERGREAGADGYDRTSSIPVVWEWTYQTLATQAEAEARPQDSDP